MSTWRRLANERFPELKDALVPVETLHDLYSELSRLLERALETNDSDLGQRVLSFALWGVGQGKNEQFLHCTIDLFSRVIESGSRRQALWSQLTPSQFAGLKDFFINPFSAKTAISAKDLEMEYRCRSLATFRSNVAS